MLAGFATSARESTWVHAAIGFHPTALPIMYNAFRRLDPTHPYYTTEAMKNDNLRRRMREVVATM